MNSLKRLISHGSIDSGKVHYNFAVRKGLSKSGQIGYASFEDSGTPHRCLLCPSGNTDGLMSCRSKSFDQLTPHKA